MMKRFDDEFEKEFQRMRRRLQGMFGSLSRPSAATLCGDTDWQPALDLYETSEKLVVLVDIAGIEVNQVEVVVDGESLRIAGKRYRPLNEQVTRIHHMEIDFGAFSQSFGLPVRVDPDQASSSYHDGFLIINLPKKARISTSVAIQSDE
jgi:HSP20 family protein